MTEERKNNGLEIAVIGMAGRFPEAGNTDKFWKNLKDGVESIPFFSDEELEKRGVSPELLNNPNLVKAGGEIEDKHAFDASFFGYTSKDSELMDPQIRVFHECAWEAMEDAGYEPGSYKGAIGIYGGASDSFDWRALGALKGVGRDLGEFVRALFTNGIFLTTRISHRLNLKGPSISMFTACSTSLVSVHMACRALLTGECDMAMAGGAAVVATPKYGYIYEEGMILSPDAHNRAFDAKAQGTVYGEGVGLVVLKRYKEAIADGDNVHALIIGSAVNNDGSDKASFPAPGRQQIANVIKTALTISKVDPESISYVEAHGTATALGDTMEIGALTEAFNVAERNYCKIGSVKTNIGHLDVAAGIAALIKTVLALKHKLIPPSLHFETPNPDLDLENSPFSVNTELCQWNNRYPLRAGVNGFGIGGNNAFLILEETPKAYVNEPPSPSREWKLLLLSTRTGTALEQMAENLVNHLEQNPVNPDLRLADAAYTLQVGRKMFQYRRMLVCSDAAEAVELLSTPDSRKVKTFVSKHENRSVVFLFAGVGSQYVNMGLELYQKGPVFREEMDRCFEILQSLVQEDIKGILYPGESGNRESIDACKEKLNRMEVTQPVIFIFEYALARLLMKWGITPRAMIGYSLGEYAAACLSGVFSLEDALKLIVTRGKLVREVQPGVMLSVPMPKEELEPILKEYISNSAADISFAIDNGPSCILAGSPGAMDTFETYMKEKKYLCMRVQTTRAIHSHMMEPILERFEQMAGQMDLRKPCIPFISNVTGTWITDEEAVSPAYWAKHLRHTVRFADGIKTLAKEPGSIFIEIGPGRDISTLIARYIDNDTGQYVVNMIRHPEKNVSDVYFLLSKIGQLWLYGKAIDWAEFYAGEKRRRVSLPTYPFQRQVFYMEGDPFTLGAEMMAENSQFRIKPDFADWFYLPTWKRSRWSNDTSWQELAGTNWLVFVDESDWGLKLVEQLEEKNLKVITVRVGERFEKNRGYTINPGQDEDYKTLFSELAKEESIPDRIIHLWGISRVTVADALSPLKMESINKALDLGFYSLVGIAQALAKLNISNEIRMMAVTNNVQELIGEDRLCPEKSIVLGAVKGIPKEYANLTLRSVDIVLPEPGSAQEQELIRQLLNECVTASNEPIIAIRENRRWIEIYEPVRLENNDGRISRLREDGVYLVTGGFGGIGFVLAEHLAKQGVSKLVLTGRSEFPAREQWDHWLTTHDEENSISRKIRKVQQLEELGADVLVLCAEADNPGQMQQALKTVEEQFGPINGVVHSAGVPDGTMIQLRTRETSEHIFATKIRGTVILDNLLDHAHLDFFLVCSSIDSIVAVAGMVGYCAANIFLNAFARYKVHSGGPFTVSVSWPRWQGLGMAVIQEDLHKQLKGVELTGGLTIPQGMDAFSRILDDRGGEPITQVAVFNIDMQAVIERDYLVGTEAFMEEFGTSNYSETVFQRPELNTDYVAPRNELEEAMADIWQNLFGIDRIGVQDDFFELGGDSLKVVIAISKIHKELNIEIPVSEFFNNPNIEALTEFMSGAEESAYSVIEPVEEREYYPLSSAQKRFFILQQMALESTVYNNPGAVKIEGSLDTEGLEQSFRKLIQRHESLRTCFVVVDGTPVQVVHKDVDFAIEYFEVTEAKAQETGRRFTRAFDLAKAPLFRVGLIKISENIHILLFDMHHLITDLSSTSMFIKEVVAIYSGIELPGLRLQYKDFCQWQYDMLGSGQLKKQEEFWLKQFSGEPPTLNLPFDYPRPPVQSYEGDVIMSQFEPGFTRQLNQLMKETGTTLFMMLVALCSILLSKYSRQKDIIIGSPIAGRHHTDFENLIGLLVETIAVRNYPIGDKTFVQFLGEVKENTLKTIENQVFPFGEVVRQVWNDYDRSRNPLFDFMLMVQNVEGSREEVSGVEGLNITSYGDSFHKVAKMDITLEVEEMPETIYFKWEYCIKLFKKETMERFVNSFRKIVSTVVADKEIKLKDIEISYDLVEAASDVYTAAESEFDF